MIKLLKTLMVVLAIACLVSAQSDWDMQSDWDILIAAEAEQQRTEETKWSKSVSAPDLQKLVLRAVNRKPYVFEVGRRSSLFALYEINGKRVGARINQRANTTEIFINDILVFYVSKALLSSRIKSITVVNKDPNLGFGIFDVE